MEYVELVARQALLIEELRDENKDLHKRMDAIRLHIICIGGPLNDNKLGYSPMQLTTFAKIMEEAEE